jgi:hypothetical protein
MAGSTHTTEIVDMFSHFFKITAYTLCSFSFVLKKSECLRKGRREVREGESLNKDDDFSHHLHLL